MGDINIPINKADKFISEYNSSLLSHGMIVTNTNVTRPASGNILDHLICSFLKVERVYNSTIESDISDHNFIFSKLSFKSKYARRKLSKTSINYSKVNQLFDEFLYSSTFNTCNPDSVLIVIIEKYNELVAKFSVSKVTEVKIKNSNNCPWMTFDLWKLIKDKTRIIKRLKRKMNDTELKSKLVLLNKRIKSGKYFAKKHYFQTFLNNLNQKEIWKQINELMKNSTGPSFQSILYKNIEYNNPGCIARIFNAFFVNVGASINVASAYNTDLNQFGTLSTIYPTFFLSPTSASEVFNIICGLDNNKSGGYDGIRSTVLKLNSTYFSHLLAELYNIVFETGIYPDCLKIAKVVPIFKSGDCKCINNYRPISLLSVFDKILEKIIANQMIEFLNDNHFFNSHQFGFRKDMGTDMAIVEISDFIYRAFDNHKYVGALFLDLQKAFDCVNHDLLLQKLHYCGFRGHAYKLLKSYLDNRKQFVIINNVKSDTLDINCGVPQGSILGPLLFLIFINDIARLPLSGQVRMFADDTAILYESNDCLDIYIRIKCDLCLFLDFLNLNKISVNFNKSKYLVFHSTYLKHCDLPLLQISNEIIARVDKFKYLGMIFDKHMSWEDHINHLSLKVCPFINLIRKLSGFVPVQILKMIYFAFIHSRFYYGIIAFGNAAKTRLYKLQVLQNKCCKAIYRLPQLFPTKKIYQDIAVGIVPINALFEYHIAIYMYKGLNTSFALSNVEFEYVNHRYMTRSSNLLQCYPIKTEFGRRSISYLGPFTYNQFSELFKDSINILKFKKQIKTLLLSSAEDYL